MLDLAGRAAIVTGGSSGIGLGIARRLASRGCSVALVGRDQASLERAASETGGLPLVADVSDPKAMPDVVEQTIARFGRLDVLVNNAGAGPMARVADMTHADWRWLLDLNVIGVVNGIRAALPVLRSNPGGGHVLNTASVAGMFTAPGIAGYSATKYAVVAISESLGAEMDAEGGRVGVGVFLPGPVRSNISNGSRNRPPELDGGGLRDVELEDAEGFEGVTIPWMSADAAGEAAVRGIERRERYVWTHPEGATPIFERFDEIRRSINAAAQAREYGS